MALLARTPLPTKRVRDCRCQQIDLFEKGATGNIRLTIRVAESRDAIPGRAINVRSAQ